MLPCAAVSKPKLEDLGIIGKEGQFVRKIIYGILVRVRNAVSRRASKAYPTTDWEPEIPDDLKALSTFMRNHYEWTEDPVHGLLDHIKPVGHMNLSLKDNELIRGDCDDLSTYTAYMLGRMGYRKIYRVNVISHLHVICVFKHDDHYRYADNSRLYDSDFSTARAAIQHCANRRDETKKARYYTERMRRT